MKINELLALGLMMSMGSLPSAFAQGGDKVGGGGGGHYCGVTAKTEMYDLYEGKNIWGLLIPQREGSVEEILKSRIAKVALKEAAFAKNIEQTLVYVMKHKKGVVGKQLTPPVDYNKIMVDVGCEYRVIGYWHDTSGNIFYDQPTFESLATNQDIAAFYFHEAIYKLARDYSGAANSDKIRHYNAEVFSDGPITVDLETGKSGPNFVQSFQNQECWAGAKYEVLVSNSSIDEYGYYLVSISYKNSLRREGSLQHAQTKVSNPKETMVILPKDTRFVSFITKKSSHLAGTVPELKITLASDTCSERYPFATKAMRTVSDDKSNTLDYADASLWAIE